MCAVSGVTDDQSLKKFVECAAERIEASDTPDGTLRLLDEFRDDEGNWNDGETYLILLTARGGVYFHANDREVEEMDWSGVLFCEGGGSVLDAQEGCFIEYDGERRGYAHPFSASHVPMVQGEDEFILLGGFDETPGREPLTGGTDGGGGCALGEVMAAARLACFWQRWRCFLRSCLKDTRRKAVRVELKRKQSGLYGESSPRNV